MRAAQAAGMICIHSARLMPHWIGGLHAHASRDRKYRIAVWWRSETLDRKRFPEFERGALGSRAVFAETRSVGARGAGGCVVYIIQPRPAFCSLAESLHTMWHMVGHLAVTGHLGPFCGNEMKPEIYFRRYQEPISITCPEPTHS